MICGEKEDGERIHADHFVCHGCLSGYTKDRSDRSTKCPARDCKFLFNAYTMETTNFNSNPRSTIVLNI